MQDIQEIFSHVQEMQRNRRSIRKEYQDILAQEAEYQQVVEEIKKLRERKQQIELKARESMGRRFQEFEDLGEEISSEQEMMSDIAMSTLMEGKSVEVTDEYENKYDPVFSVKFKKAQ